MSFESSSAETVHGTLAAEAATGRASAEETQRATLNILEDLESERARLEEAQRASLNILEDFGSEKVRLQQAQQASFNILDDFELEKERLEETKRAAFNILDDFGFEKVRSEEAQRATLNVLEDFDEEKQKVERRTIELDAANQELDAFAYSVSHDLRAPLRSMDGFSRILLEEYAQRVPNEAKHYLQMVQESATEMGHLIDDLLEFSRLGRKKLAKQPVEMRGVVEQALEDLRADRAGRSIRFRIEPLAACDADPGLLKQVFVNLLGNAVKYTRTRAIAEIEIGSRVKGDDLVYFVKDNGVGFDMEHAGKLFGVFQRLHRAEEFQGTGVGLAIARRILQRHGGRIWAEARPDQGATFYFAIPQGVPAVPPPGGKTHE